MIAFVVGFFGYFAGYFQVWKADPLECIANFLSSKKTFMVFDPTNAVLVKAKFVFVNYPNSSSGRNFYRFSFEVTDDGVTTGFLVTLSDLKTLNKGDQFSAIFDGIDKILMDNPDLKFC